MKYTNQHDLPDYLRLWLEYDDYDYLEGIVSATGLLSPPRQIVLKARHFDSLEVDLADLIARRYGSALHASFEQVDMPRITQEQRVIALVDKRKVSGKFDMLKDIGGGRFRIIDIKSTSVWNAIYGSSAEEWKLQLSIYRYLLERDGWAMDEGEMVEREAITVDKHAEICLVFTDWKKADMNRHKDYPPIRVAHMDIDLYHPDFTRDFIATKLEAIAEAEELPDADLPFCTDEELWKDKDTFAVKKEGRKSAVRVYDTLEEAKMHIENIDKESERLKHSIEKRKGYVKRCPYCDVRSVCNQYDLLVEQGLIAGEE